MNYIIFCDKKQETIGKNVVKKRNEHMYAKSCCILLTDDI